MKALAILKYLHNGAELGMPSLNKINEAIKELENMKQQIDSKSTDITLKDYCVSLEKRITHIENTLEQIFRASAYNKDALNKNNSVWHYFKSRL